jgi:hypothetical protein
MQMATTTFLPRTQSNLTLLKYNIISSSINNQREEKEGK